MSLIVSAAAIAALAQPALDACYARMPDYSTWRETPGQQWDYRWAGDAGAVTILGSEHLRDPANAQFARFSAAFAEARPTLALFEGPDRGVDSSEEATIRNMGESGQLRFLARAAGVPVRSLEPSPGQQVAMLLGEYPIDQVLLFFTLRESARLRDREGLSGAALDTAVGSLLQRVSQMGSSAGLTLPFTDVPGLDRAAARYWPGRDWRSFPANWFSPGANDAETGGVFVGAINRADSTNRNRHMVREIAEAARRGERVFAVVGRNHVPMQAPALDCALGR
ncbi:MAG: hypothetical protein ACK4SZ_16590 [Allosphingosinicella sp.]|uniref:hypothetical protein n=1 Tax=Allosphingosinicella sp. TaxID=2823234 RepID=UPI00395998C2